MAQSNGSSKWVINEGTCRIEPIYKGEYVLAFNIRMADLQHGATLMSDVRADAVGQQMQKLFQLYVELGHRIVCETRKYVNLVHRFDPGAGEQPNLVSFFVESVLAKEPGKYSHLTFYIVGRNPGLPGALREASLEGEEQEEEEEPEGENIDADPGAGRARVIKKSKTPRVAKEDLPCLDPNILWNQLISKVLSLHNNKGRGYGIDLKKLSMFERWKTVRQLDELAYMHDFYNRHDQAINNFDKISNRPLSDSQNMLSATSIFSAHNLVKSRGNDCHDLQGARQVCDQVWSNDGTQHSLQFPLRKFVMRINPVEFTNESLWNRILPHHQGDRCDRIAAALPMILHDVLTRSSVFSEFGASQNQEPAARLEIQDGELRLVQSEGTDDNEFEEIESVFRELVARSGLQDVLRSNAPQFDESYFGRFGNVADTSYLGDFVQRWISDYTPLTAFSVAMQERLTQLAVALRSGQYKVKSPEAVLYRLDRLTKLYLFKEWLVNCRTDESTITETGRAMYRNGLLGERLYQKAAKICYSKVDPALGTLDNYTIIKAAEDAQIHFVAAVGPNQLVSQYRYSAYDSKLDQIKLNFLMSSGKGATGKSFLLDLLRKRCIEGTVSVESYRSTRADADHTFTKSDAIVIMHELDMSLVGTEEGGKMSGDDGERARMFKERLTSNIVSARILTIDEQTKKRRTDIHTTECITAFFAATNTDVNRLMSHACATRWHNYSYDDGSHLDDIFGLTAFESLFDEDQRVIRDLNVTEYHLMQLLMFELFKMFQVGIMERPSTHVASIMLLLFQNGLKDSGLERASTRDLIRTMLLASIKCMMEAICMFFFFKGGKHQGKPIEPIYLLDLERCFFVKPSHVVSAIGEQIDFFVNPAEEAVAGLIRDYWKQTPESRREYRQHVIRSFDNAATDYKRRGIQDFNASTTIGQIAHDQDYNYPCFKLGSGFGLQQGSPLDTFVKKLHDFSRCQHDDLVRTNPSMSPEIVSAAAIRKTLTSWTNRTFFAYKYIINGGKQVIVDASEAPCAQQIAIIDKWRIYVHLEFLDGVPDLSRYQKVIGPRDVSFSNVSSLPLNALPLNASQSEAEDIEALLEGLSVEDAERVEKKRVPVSTGEGAVENILRGILSKKYQRPMKLLFTTNKRFNYIRNIIEIKPSDIGSTGRLIVASPVHMDNVMSKILSNKKDFLGDFCRAEAMLIPYDLETYGIRMRNQLLHITKEVIDPSFKTTFHLFGENITPSAVTDDDYDGAYFLGRPIQQRVDFQRLSRQKNFDTKIQDIYQQLDQKWTMDDVSGTSSMDSDDLDAIQNQLYREATSPEESDLIDDGFCLNDFIVREAKYDENTEELLEPALYHWQMQHLPKAFQNPRTYKLMCYHSALTEDLALKRFYSATETSWYPRNAISQVEAGISDIRKRVSDYIDNDVVLKQAIKEQNIYIPSYTVITTEKGVKRLVGDDYGEFGSFFGGETLSDTLRTSQKRRRVDGRARLFDDSSNDESSFY